MEYLDEAKIPCVGWSNHYLIQVSKILHSHKKVPSSSFSLEIIYFIFNTLPL